LRMTRKRGVYRIKNFLLLKSSEGKYIVSHNNMREVYPEVAR